ncbi:benzoate transporter [Nitratireductor sp. StC3]|nr:benzoate transporter [Nitratireductor sp. StC3]
MRLSLIVSALVAVIVGFGGSVAIVIAAAEAVGASPAATSSWLAAVCLAKAIASGYLSTRHRMPIVLAWSTPGAALVATSSGIGFAEAVGAFAACAILILLTALVRPLGDLVRRIPTSLATAVLAGVLFDFVLGAVTRSATLPLIGVPMIAIFVTVRLWSPSWAVIGALVAGFGTALAFGLNDPLPAPVLSEFVWTTPRFDAAALIGLALPLYIVTMASQNLPGFAVLRADGYDPPVRSILGVTGLASLVSAPFGAHTTSLAAITASICTGPDAHPDPARRWLGGLVYAGGYIVLAAVAASVVALFAAFPAELILILAGLALTGPFIGALSAAVSTTDDAFAAIVTFVVTASGLTLLGIGAAFWGLMAGLALEGARRIARREPARPRKAAG